MFACAACGSDFNDGPHCAACQRKYDYQCAGITESGYRRLGKGKNSWRCPECKASSQSPGVQSPLTLDKVFEELKTMNVKLASLTTLLEDIKTIKSEIGGIQTSLNMAHDKITHLESRVKSIEVSTKDVNVFQNEINRLKTDFQDREQWARANNVEVKGIPLKTNENLYDIALKIGSVINFAIKKEDINFISRVSSLNFNAKPIIISFNNRYVKENLIAAYRKFKDLNLKSLNLADEGRVFIHDHLTIHNKQLLNKTKALAKEQNFQFVWVKHCKIMARKSPTSPIQYIKTESDLKKIK